MEPLNPRGLRLGVVAVEVDEVHVLARHFVHYARTRSVGMRHYFDLLQKALFACDLFAAAAVVCQR